MHLLHHHCSSTVFTASVLNYAFRLDIVCQSNSMKFALCRQNVGRSSMRFVVTKLIDACNMDKQVCFCPQHEQVSHLTSIVYIDRGARQWYIKLIVIMQWIWAFWVQFLKPVSNTGMSMTPILEYQVIQDWVISLFFFSIEIRGCKWAYKLLVSKLELMLKILMKKGCAKLFYGGMLDYFRKTTPLEEAKSEWHFCGYIIPGSYFRVRAHLFKEPDKGTSICSAATR